MKNAMDSIRLLDWDLIILQNDRPGEEAAAGRELLSHPVIPKSDLLQVSPLSSAPGLPSNAGPQLL